MIEQKKPVELIDLDALAKTKRIVKVAGKSIDVSVIPARLSLRIAKFSDEEETLSGVDKIQAMFDIMASVCAVQDTEVDADWLMDHLSLEGVSALTSFIMKPIRERATAAIEGNAAAVQSE